LCAFVISLALVVLSACVKKGGEAIVVGKEYKPSAEIIESPADDETERTPAEGAASSRAEESPIPATSPRMSEEEWILSVQMVADQRWIDVRVDKARWEKLREGDRVKVTYREGKYTGTTYSAEIR
jgi:hypothetical protein